jgi:hypothetical protein
MTNDHSHPQTHDEPIDWKVHGVKVIPADKLAVNTAQTPGMNRAAIVDG